MGLWKKIKLQPVRGFVFVENHCCREQCPCSACLGQHFSIARIQITARFVVVVVVVFVVVV